MFPGKGAASSSNSHFGSGVGHRTLQWSAGDWASAATEYMRRSRPLDLSQVSIRETDHRSRLTVCNLISLSE